MFLLNPPARRGKSLRVKLSTQTLAASRILRVLPASRDSKEAAKSQERSAHFSGPGIPGHASPPPGMFCHLDSLGGFLRSHILLDPSAVSRSAVQLRITR